jgi:hypothetical protein
MPRKKKVEATPDVVQGSLKVPQQYYLRIIEPILAYRREQARSLKGTVLHIPSLLKVIEGAQVALDNQVVSEDDREMVARCIDDLLKPMVYDQARWFSERKIALAIDHEDAALFLYVLPSGQLKSERRKPHSAQ